MKKLSLKAFAKINIGLNIISKRADGYHEIETIFQLIDLYDTIIISKRNDAEIVLNSNNIKIPMNQDNICYEAASLLRDLTGISEGINVTINKRIPIGAGLGGGSSDAASVLKGLIKIWGLSLDEVSLMNIAKQIGADVPFFLKGGTAFATGIGEKLTPIELSGEYYCVLVNPNIEISTKWAYKNYNFSLTKTKKIIKLSQILQKNISLFDLRNYIKNDFEEVVFREFPVLGEVKNKLYQSGAFFTSMSGSGSTIFGLFKDILKANDAIGIFPKSYQTILAQPIFEKHFKPSILSYRREEWK